MLDTLKVAKGSESVSNSIFLLFPPGWTYTTGGTNFAVPLLKGYLEGKGIETHSIDLNILLSDYYGFKVSDYAVVNACETSSLESLNQPYYTAQEQISEIARPYDAIWDIQAGFNYTNCYASSSEDIREYS